MNQKEIFQIMLFKLNIKIYKKWQDLCWTEYAGTSQRILELGWVTFSNF